MSMFRKFMGTVESGGGVVTDGLELWLDASNIDSYPQSGTTWFDLSGNNNNGTLVNGVAFNGESMVFDGVNDYVSLPGTLETSGAVTASCWFYRSVADTVNADAIMGNYYWSPTLALKRGWCFRYYQSTPNALLLMIELTDGVSIKEYSASVTTELNKWYCATFSFDPATRNLRFYVNDALVYNTTVLAGYNAIATQSPVPFRIGYNPTNAGYFNGKIPVALMYHSVLTAEEVVGNFNALKSRFGY